VSKSSEALSDAPAAIYVISHEDIIRSGATTIPEMLRLAPNLEVAQLSPTAYAISARGFNVGDNASLSNKLLVLIDGRSVYTPLFGGVYWDLQEVLPENIERIEVISGPGATLWGANAVNGVINIITRSSSQTQGGSLTVGGGNLEFMAALQYGGRIDDDLTYRVHAEGFEFSPYQTSSGQSAHDGWNKPDGGFRLDWRPPSDQLMLEGDQFAGNITPNGYITGRDVVGDWQHEFGNGSKLQLLAYYDLEGAYVNGGGPGISVETYDAELQHSFTFCGWNNIVWGAGERAFSYQFENTALVLQPPNRTLNLANIFGQDTISLTDRLKLTLGLKVEDEPYARFQFMPSARASFKPWQSVLLWSAVSRAVRSPTPVDEDLREYVGAIDFLSGSHSFMPEVLTSYEAGTRVQLSSRASLSVSTFYDVYDNLRSIGLSPAPEGLPYVFRNQYEGHVYGAEFWGDWRVTDWWRLAAGFNIQHEALHCKAGDICLAEPEFTADDPNQQASLRSYINFGNGVTWDADLRYVGKLPDPVVPGYVELNTRLGWKINRAWEISASGFNLLHPRHLEFFEQGETDYIPRSYFLQAIWRF
jgi:iron complex outermembrane receptor protein